MEPVEIRFLNKPMLKNPIMICGLPDNGYVAKLAVDYLRKELNATLFAEIYSDSFPPQVVIKPDGLAELMKNELYISSDPESGLDIVIYTGDSQPLVVESAYKIADRVLDVASELGVRDIYILAAYIRGGLVDKPKVYGTATQTDMLEEMKRYGVIPTNEGSITWMHGLLLGLAKARGLRAICLSSETPGYVVDAKASHAVLDVISRKLGLKLDLSFIERRAKETEAIIKGLEEAHRRPKEWPVEYFT